jgi:type III secretory pathway lipoprotein EscJ
MPLKASVFSRYLKDIRRFVSSSITAIDQIRVVLQSYEDQDLFAAHEQLGTVRKFLLRVNSTLDLFL